MKNTQYGWVKVFITVIRMAVGWHFLYEGLVKLFSPGWSAQPYLLGTIGFTSDFFHWLATNPDLMKIVDILNIAGLTLIGLGLFFGFFTRIASVFGALLLFLFYLAYPPFGISTLSNTFDNNFIVDKLLIELLVFLFFVFSNQSGYSIDSLIQYYKRQKKERHKEKPLASVEGRREMIKNLVGIPVFGVLGAGAYKNYQRYEVDALSGATIQLNRVALSELEGELPKGKIKDIEISRLIMGGNLIGGWAHARDLLYAEQLFKAYNTEKKIFDTLMLCEQAGINAINIGFPTVDLMAKYKKLTGSKIKVFTQVGIREESENIYEDVSVAIDKGMDFIQLQGNWCDWLVRDGKLDIITGIMEYIRKQNYPAGIGAHTVDSLIACEQQGITPDFYMKTMHHDQYWSAHPRENRVAFEVDGKRHLDHNLFHDNCFCPFPDRTVEFVNQTKVPVVGFKVLAAGAIRPKDGFNWAFENGADFICVGMFDFQVVNDTNICIKVLQDLQNRKRAWYG